jgi:hypothetical protein
MLLGILLTESASLQSMSFGYPKNELFYSHMVSFWNLYTPCLNSARLYLEPQSRHCWCGSHTHCYAPSHTFQMLWAAGMSASRLPLVSQGVLSSRKSIGSKQPSTRMRSDTWIPWFSHLLGDIQRASYSTPQRSPG